MSENKVITDNWTLELAAKILSRNDSFFHDYRQQVMPPTNFDTQTFDDVIKKSYTNPWRDYEFPGRARRNQGLEALLQLLDLLVLYDGLALDIERTFTWERFPGMQPLSPIISKIKLSDDTKEKIKSEAEAALGYTPDIRTDPLIAGGALYYLGLANILGLDYWASPERAEFISDKLCNRSYQNAKGFITVLDRFVDEKLESLVNELLQDENLKELRSKLYFPGFGTSILAKCKSREEILPIAIEFRQSSECTEFREWLKKMDEATREGNLLFVSKNMRELQGVASEVRKSLLGESPLENVELEIGLSPTIKFNAKTINAVFQQYKPKKLHLSFLRKHFYRVLAGTNLKAQTYRLFPELQ